MPHVVSKGRLVISTSIYPSLNAHYHGKWFSYRTP
jgi:hypothetical protein